MVKLKVAESLADKKIFFLPGGGKNGVRTTNMNDLLSRFAVGRAAEAAEEKK